MRHHLSPRACFFLASPFVVGLAACSSSPPVPEVPIGAPKPAASSQRPIDLSLAYLTAAEKPAKLVVDGDLAEWGSIAPPESTPGAKDPLPAAHVAIALDSKGAALAAEVATEPSEGLWVGLSFGDPLLPPIGTWLRSGGIAELDCEHDMDGQPLDPDAAASCKKLLSDHEAFGEAHRARFRRVYKLDDKGIRAAGPGGTLVPIDGAQCVFKKTPSGFTVEATLPAKALPRTQEAPLQDFSAMARVLAGAKPPAVEPESWGGLSLPKPVGFEPHAALRQAIFEAAKGGYRQRPFALSYQPGDGLEMERVGYSREGTTSVESQSAILYSHQADLGDIEVGYANIDGEAIAVLKGGQPTSVVAITGEPRAVVRRGDQLHVFSYDRYSPSDMFSTDYAAWFGWAVQPDGSVREGIVLKDGTPFYWAQNDLVEGHSPDHSELSIQGHPPPHMSADKDPPTIEVTWTWDAEGGAYVPEVTDSSAPKKKPPAGKSKPAPKPAPKPAAKPTSKPATAPKK